METNNNIHVEITKRGGRKYVKAVSHEEYHILQKDENIIEIRPYTKKANRQYDAVVSGWAF